MILGSIEIIGEASKRVPPAVRDAHPQVDWRGLTPAERSAPQSASAPPQSFRATKRSRHKSTPAH